MNLEEFLDTFKAYEPKVLDTFENQWRIYTNDNGVKGLTHTILFSGQNKAEADVSVTFVDGVLVEGSIGFRDCRIIYIDDGYQFSYRNECESRYIDMDGTKNVWDWGDYIPNKYVSLCDFIDAIESYGDQCITQTQVPRYNQEVASITHTPVGDDAFYKMYDDSKEMGQSYKVQYTVTLDYEIEASSMDAAQAEASSQMYDDLCEFFDNDRIKLVKRAVIETLGE
jgi:hypothetical protein